MYICHVPCILRKCDIAFFYTIVRDSPDVVINYERYNKM